VLSLPTNYTLNTTGTGAAFTRDGAHLLTVSDGNMATLWDLKTGRPALTLSGHTDAVNSVAISPDGRTFAAASADQTAKLWDAASGKELLTLTGHPGAVGSIAFAPDGRRVYTGSDEDGTAIAWDAATGKLLYAFSGQSAATGVEAIAISPDSKRIATGEFDTDGQDLGTTRDAAADVIRH
jgi:WD40 repeat protein